MNKVQHVSGTLSGTDVKNISSNALQCTDHKKFTNVDQKNVLTCYLSA